MSLKMDENCATAQEMRATSNEIEEAIDSIANETQHSAITAGEVSMRAERPRRPRLVRKKGA